MNSTADALAPVLAGLRDVLSGDALAGLGDHDRAVLLRDLGEVTRLADAAVVETVATADAEFGHRFGCRGVNELLQRVLRVDAREASMLVRAAGVVGREVSLVSGERLPARWLALRDALLDGDLSVSGLLAATGPLERAKYRISEGERLWADGVLAGYARGFAPASEEAAPATAEQPGVGAGPAMTPEDLRQTATILAMALDPDGAEPSDRAAQQSRSLTLGRERDGVFPIRGNLTAEVAAQLQLIFDAFTNPKVGGTPAPGVSFVDSKTDEADADSDPFNSDPRCLIDPRTPAQKRHDALAATLGIAARHDDMPRLGGAAPTLVVHVDAKDMTTTGTTFGAHGAFGMSGEFGASDAAGAFGSMSGWAWIPGIDVPVSAAVAAHTACTGAVQRVLFDEGRIVGITVTDRVFTVHQRRAIVARDQECLIPGCHVPASWCEIHHVTEHARGGPTHTDNGVPLCWWHHRSLGTSGWEIRMTGGVPQIRGPAWWDPDQRWRTPRPTHEALGLEHARTG
ncbi:MAG: DUF222 domain-containing protein [Microbacterium sp.]